MPAEIFGMIGNRLASEICTPRAPVFDHQFIRDAAQAHEQGGFDRILIGYYSNAPDGFLVAAYAAAQTERLGLLLAHRPGFVAPTVAARKLATLDQLTEGRLALHVISGGSDADQRKDGDYLSHDERYARTDLIRGFDPLNNARQYGEQLVPLVRQKVARLDRARLAQPSAPAPATTAQVAVGAGR